MGDLFTYEKLCPFFDTGSRIVTQPAILAKVFHKVELRCSCWFRLFTLLIKVVLCFCCLLRYLSVRVDCVLDRVFPTLHSFACSLWGLLGDFNDPLEQVAFRVYM